MNLFRIKKIIRFIKKAVFLFNTSGATYSNLKKIGEIDLVIDVGVGHKGSPFLYENFKSSEFISIDPLEEAEKFILELPNKRHSFLKYAVGAETDEVEINVARVPSRSSLRKRTFSDTKSSRIRSQKVKIRRLDDLISSEQLQNKKVLLKLDIEGFEFEALLGATKILDCFKAIVIEFALTENFSDNAKFSQYIQLLASNNFEIFQILKAGNNSFDALFIRSDDELRKKWSYASGSRISDNINRN